MFARCVRGPFVSQPEQMAEGLKLVKHEDERIIPNNKTNSNTETRLRGARVPGTRVPGYPGTRVHG
eukprot:1241997-Rhodomonas_salina.1